jgi:hypothetical protein
MSLDGLNPHCIKLSCLKISWFYFPSLPSFHNGEYSRRIGKSPVLQVCFLSCSEILVRTYKCPNLPLLLPQIKTSFIQSNRKVFVHLTFCIVIIMYRETFWSPCSTVQLHICTKQIVTENGYLDEAFYG